MRQLSLDLQKLRELSRDPLKATLVRDFFEFKASQQDRTTLNRTLKDLLLRYSDAETKLTELNRELNKRQAQLNQDLKAAAEIQRMLVPQKPPDVSSLEIGWRFKPSDEIGGDIFQFISFDENHFIFYLIDVTGHGVPSAMITVSLSQILQPQSGMAATLLGKSMKEVALSPGLILTALEKEYPLSRFQKMFTMVYGVLELDTGKMSYANAGHPPPVILDPEGNLSFLDQAGFIMGMGMNTKDDEHQIVLRPGSKLFCYTDGISECKNPRDDLFGEERLHAYLKKGHAQSVEALLQGLDQTIDLFCEKRPPNDDVTCFLMEYRPGNPVHFSPNSNPR